VSLSVSKDEKISKLTRENEQLKFKMVQLRRLIFSSKTERFVANAIAGNQVSLFTENTEGEENTSEEKEPIGTEEISCERKKANTSKGNHQGRNKIPDHLPTREVIIETEEDTTKMKKIGEKSPKP
jgi:transposase